MLHLNTDKPKPLQTLAYSKTHKSISQLHLCWILLESVLWLHFRLWFTWTLFWDLSCVQVLSVIYTVWSQAECKFVNGVRAASQRIPGRYKRTQTAQACLRCLYSHVLFTGKVTRSTQSHRCEEMYLRREEKNSKNSSDHT